MGLREDAHRFFYYIPFLPQYFIFTLKFPHFLFYSYLVPFSWKGCFTLFSQFFAPFAGTYYQKYQDLWLFAFYSFHWFQTDEQLVA